MAALILARAIADQRGSADPSGKLEVVVTEEQVPDPNGIRFPPTTRRSAVISTGEGSRWQPVRRLGERPP